MEGRGEVRGVSYVFFATVLYLLSLLPLWVHYRLSDILYYVFYYIVRYRRHMVRKNLTESFPEKSYSEIVSIEKAFYSWLCDYFVETIKLRSVGRKNISRRMKFLNTEAIERSVSNGRSCAVYLGHYCNWEWVTSLPLALSSNATCMQIYHTLENPVSDRLFLRLRGRLGAEGIPMNETLRRIVMRRKEGKRLVIGFIADQVPLWNSIHYWTKFLNHDTPVFTGTERIARKCDFDVYYLHLRRVRRGYYEAEFKLITTTPNNYGDNEITEKYFRMLEQTIVAAPQYWLWSHNRWKRTREEWERISSQYNRNERK